VTGEQLIDYLRPRLFQPLGISGARWETCPLGINTGGYGLKVKTEDIAKFGQLYLNNGVWNGRRLLSAEWIAEATARQVSNGDDPERDWTQGYGYQFWRCRHNCYRGDGAFGQYCLVMPEQDAVLAITAGLSDMQAVLNLVWEHLLPAMQPVALPADPALDTLAQKLTNLRFDPPAGVPTSDLAARISGRTIRFAPNGLQITRAQFDFTSTGATLTLQRRGHPRVIACGAGAWQFGRNMLFGRRAQKVAASGVWTAPDTYHITMRYYETPFFQTVTCHFTEDGMTLQVDHNVGFGPKEGVKLEGRFEEGRETRNMLCG